MAQLSVVNGATFRSKWRTFSNGFPPSIWIMELPAFVLISFSLWEWRGGGGSFMGGGKSHFVRKKGKINSPLPLPALWLHAVYLWAINTIYKDAVHTLVINCTMQNCILKKLS